MWRKIQEMGKRLKNEEFPEDSSASSVSDEDTAPDGGWGWAVCFGSFLINFILDGTMFSFGVLLLELLDYFGEGKAKTTWIGSSLLGMSMLMGPVVSMLLERYSCRQITIVGTTLSVVAFIVSTFSPNVEMLILTYGIIGGVGFGMSFISSIIVVGTYFSHRRAIATGLAMSGSGLGTFAYAYLTNTLLAHYNWRGTILIVSGILLNGIVCGALFRPLVRSKIGRTRSESNSNNSSEVIDVKEIKKLLSKNDTPSTYLKTNNITSRMAMSTDFLRVQREMLLSEENIAKRFSSQDDFGRDFKTISNQMSKKDIFYSGSLARIPYHHSSQLMSSHQDSLHILPEQMAYHKEKSLILTFFDTMKTNFKMFNDNVFVLLLLTNVCWTVQSVPLTYIPDLGISKNLATSEAAMLISIVGITNIFGRIFSGIITDVFRIKSSVMYTIALFTASAVNFMFPRCEGFVSLAVCGAVFGLCMATVVSMRTIVLVDHLGIEQLTQSFGMIALFQGIAFMTNAPLAGYIYEKSNSYMMPFSFAGVMYLLSGIFCVAVQCVKHENRGPVVEIIINESVECDSKTTKQQEQHCP